MKKLYLIDASGYIYRSYYAIRQMTNDKGESTNALFGFIRSVLKLIKDFQPTHLAAVFDGPSNALARTTLFADYKAHRKGTPADLVYQITWAQTFCQLMGIPELMVPEVEADDTIGSVAKWAEQEDAEVFLCTSDKDMCQLVTDKIFILNTFKDNLILGPEDVRKQFGVTPRQIIDFLAITGDASDNVPGLSGFGPKTAADLLQKFGCLDNLLAHPTFVVGQKKQETLVREKEKVLLSRQLVTINTSVEFMREYSFFKFEQPPTEPLKEFYTYMNFSSLIRELQPIEEKDKEEPTLIEKYHYTCVADEETLQKLVSFLSNEREICVDTETTSIYPLQASLVGIGLGIQPGEAWYIPMNGKLDKDSALSILKPLFENPAIGFYGHNLKYDFHVLLQNGLKIANLSFDTFLSSYLLNSHSRKHSLDHLSLEFFGKVKTPIQDLIGKGKNEISMHDAPIDKVSLYCCEDVDYTIRLKKILSTKLKERKLEALFYELELPLLSILAGMERRGIFVDVHSLKQLSEKLEKNIQLTADAIYSMAGESFNLNSPKQLSAVLFDKLGIKPPKKIATGHSTNAEVLESLQTEYPIAAKLLEYRTLEKLRSTYVETLPQQVNPLTGRIHCTFNQSGTATGRLSCQDPNLQNIPVRSEIGREIREAFCPQLPNWSYLAADYSQIELRLLAHLSEDPMLMKAFESNEDIHAFTASQIFDIPLTRVTKEQRHQAKTVNFGIMYGQQAFGLSKELGIDLKSASLFIEMYFARYHKVKDFLNHSKAIAKESGKAVSLLGRERLIPEITSSNPHIRMAAERLAVNTPIQGTQADLIKLAMLDIEKRFAKRNLKSFMILQIHDELLFEVPDNEIEEVKCLVHQSMEGVMKLKVPLIVDIHVGKNWKEC